MEKPKDILLVLPIPLRSKENQLLVESQAYNGLKCWADNFGSVVVAAPVIPESLAELNKSRIWCDATALVDSERLEIVTLPWAYSLPEFFRCYRSVRASIGKLIARCRYLQFAIGGLWGDWAAVAALEAHGQGRAYAIHADRVEHEVIIRATQEKYLPIRLKMKIISLLMARYHQWIIKKSALGLWHGNDCYYSYGSFCANSHLIHNIHLKPADRISPIDLDRKIKEIKNAPKLLICYAGRIHPMKGPIDWVKAIARARDLGVNLHATWLGEGPMLEQMKTAIAQLNLDDCIELKGFEGNRDKLLKTIQESHIMLFTHVTPESPRCLIEALVCGTPIIGYQSNYPQDLVKDFGGGMFAPMHNWEQLGDIIANLSQDRQGLSQLIQKAATNGTRFNDQAVFSERSELIKKHLP